MKAIQTEYNCKLTSLNLPSIKKIFSYGIQSCSNLQSVTFSDCLEEIATAAMRSCTSLTKLVLPTSLRFVGDNAFSGCSGMKKIVILSESVSLGSSALSGMSSLEDVYVPWRYMEKSGEPWGITTATIHYIDEGWMDDLESIIGD